VSKEVLYFILQKRLI